LVKYISKKEWFYVIKDQSGDKKECKCTCKIKYTCKIKSDAECFVVGLRASTKETDRCLFAVQYSSMDNHLP
jgi:hypothetical protein